MILLLMAATAACERAATDPSVVEEERAATVRAAPNTLHVLFDEALRTAHRRNGVEAVETILTDWEARQHEVQAAYAAGDPATLQARLEALRNEEIQFILDVLGRSIITRVLSESNVSLAMARARLMEAGRQGADVATAEASAEEISQLLSRATALSAREPAQALRVATEAARLLAGIDDAIIELRRLRGVETLFPEIVDQLKAEELRHHARLQGAAHAALRSVGRQQAGELLAAVRREEIRLVLKATHNRASAQLLQQVDGSLAELRKSLDAVKARGAEVIRLERMLATAHDLHHQAERAETAGDHAAALDLASHAAGLLNSLRHLLVK